MTRGSDQRIELELALVQPVRAAPADAGGTRYRQCLPVRRLSLQSCSRFASAPAAQPFASAPAQPAPAAAATQTPAQPQEAVPVQPAVPAASRTADCRAGTGRTIVLLRRRKRCRFPRNRRCSRAETAFAVGGTARIGGAARCPGTGSAAVCPAGAGEPGRPGTRQVPIRRGTGGHRTPFPYWGAGGAAAARKTTPCCTPTCASQKPISTVPVC